ncbi:MAG TPA: alpha/beta hydrolase domain-containing protein [Stellaceae bacterium]|nr:alpha/beta hydrolase domain-containing protein [Stellaceae bacterium]
MAVVALEVKTRQALAGGEEFGNVGRYVQLDGTAHFALDPAHPLNRAITDIDLAALGGDGWLHFAADFRILLPEDQRRGNHRLLFDVVNRGNRLALSAFNRVPRPIDPGAPTAAGDGFLMRQGYTVAWCGWQHDVPATEGLMRIALPEAREAGGPISGRLLVSFQPNAPSRVQLLSDRGHRPYPCADLGDPEALLLVRDGDDAPPRVIPRHDWSFARLEGERVVPDANQIYLAAGFEPGKLYHVIYRTTGAPVIGLGLVAARDFVAFLRHGGAVDDNPCAGEIAHAYAFGASQSGRYLRQFLYLGLNEDEAQRTVFDGMLVHIAGGKRGGDFNQRFGQPSASLHPTLSNAFPFNERASSDPVTGQRDGLLERLAARGHVPKLFFTNSSHEYWRGDASLIHTDAAGTRDVAPAATSRFYHFAGAQHSAGTLPLTDTNAVDGARGQQKLNSVDYNPLLRALLVRMDRWVTSGEEPPPSCYPRLDDASAVAPEQLRGVFTAIPGVGFPARPPQVVRLDFGPAAAAGIATTLPPKEGEPYPHFVPAVDLDGNEVSGIRLPDVSVPLATYAGWNLRHPQMGAPERMMSLMGATIPFPATREDRARTGDPRRSIDERYPDKAAYLDQVRREARTLADAGYLLAEDLEPVVVLAARRFDLLAAVREPAAAQ